MLCHRIFFKTLSRSPSKEGFFDGKNMNAEILTSTGALGISHRDHDRYYLNSPWGVLANEQDLERLAHFGQRAIDAGRNSVTRCVARCLVSSSTIENIATSEVLRPLIEAVVPVPFAFSGQEVWMVMFGQNHRLRQPLASMETMVAATVDRPKSQSSVADRIQSLQAQGFSFLTTISGEQFSSVYTLWHETFGWESAQVTGLQGQLVAQRELPRSYRSVWFSGIVAPQNNELVALAMAERLDMPIGDGRSLSVVESTEWRTKNGWEGRGIMAGAVTHLHNQVLFDLADLPTPPLVIAEANFMTRADLVGRSVGMRIAQRHIGALFVPQVLRQNIPVVDGKNPPELRDFIFMYQPGGAV